MKKYTFIFIIIILNSTFVFSQSNTDSLKFLLKTLNEEKIATVLNELASIDAEYYPDSSLVFATQALNLAEKYKIKNETAEAHRQIGRCLIFLGKYDSALISLEKAIKLFEELENYEGLANCKKNLGRLYENQYDYNKALEYYFESLKIFESNNLKKGVAEVSQDIGYVYIYTQNFENALNYYNNALKIFEELKENYSISIVYNNIGITYDSMGETDKAIEYYNKSIEINQSLGNEIVAAYIMHNIGIIYNDKNILDTALTYFNKSLNICQAYEDSYGISYNFTRIAAIYKKRGMLDSALNFLDKSLEYTILIDDKTARSENYLEYSNIYELKNDYYNAFEFYKKYEQLKDTVFNEEILKQMNELEAKYQTEKKETENLLLKEQRRKQELFTYFLAIIIIFVVFLALLFLRGKFKQQKVNKLLEIKNHEINMQKEEIQAQAEELEKLSIVASETDNAIMIMNSDGDFEWVNDGFTRLYGYNLEEFKQTVGINIKKINSNSNPNIISLLERCFLEKQTIIYESQVISKDKHQVWAQTTITPIIDSLGKISKFIAIDSDIRKLKKAETEILQKNEEILTQSNELEIINEQIEKQNEQIKGSIRYAKTIQNAILPSISEIEKKYSIITIYKPKDIVSGDFYWFVSVENYDFIVVADCTGHGVPGAFMSMIGSRLLNEVIIESKTFEPKLILQNLDYKIEKALKKEVTDVSDGMDLALCRIENKNSSFKILFGGAKRPLVYSKDNQLFFLNGDRRSIGGYKRNNISRVEFSQKEILLSQKDIIYLFSDGYIDQNNVSRTRYGSKRLIASIDEIKNMDLTTQKNILLTKLDDWQKLEEQRDDITLIALQFK